MASPVSQEERDLDVRVQADGYRSSVGDNAKRIRALQIAAIFVEHGATSMGDFKTVTALDGAGFLDPENIDTEVAVSSLREVALGAVQRVLERETQISESSAHTSDQLLATLGDDTAAEAAVGVVEDGGLAGG